MAVHPQTFIPDQQVGQPGGELPVSTPVRHPSTWQPGNQVASPSPPRGSPRRDKPGHKNPVLEPSRDDDAA